MPRRRKVAGLSRLGETPLNRIDEILFCLDALIGV